MNLVRKYKISKILNQPLEGVDNEIILFIKGWLKDLIPFKYDEYPDTIFYMSKEGLYVLEQDYEHNKFWIRYKSFWGVLSTKYLIDYDDTQLLLKFMIEEVFKNHITSDMYFSYDQSIASRIEEAFKTELKTIRLTAIDKVNRVEDEYKKEK